MPRCLARSLSRRSSILCECLLFSRTESLCSVSLIPHCTPSSTRKDLEWFMSISTSDKNQSFSFSFYDFIITFIAFKVALTEAQYFMFCARSLHVLVRRRQWEHLCCRKNYANSDFVAPFCLRAQIQKPCGCIINNRTELYWMLNFHFHTSYGNMYSVVIVAVMTEDISRSDWNKREISVAFWKIMTQTCFKS